MPQPTSSGVAPCPGEADLLAHVPCLLALARRHLPRSVQGMASAEDLVQSTLLTAWKARQQFQGQSAAELRCWLCRILVNVAGQLRRRWLRSQAWLAHNEGSLLGGPGLASRGPSAPPADEQERLDRAMDRLTPAQRRIVAFRLTACSFPEISRHVGKSPDAVRMLYNRALRRLRALLAPC